MQTTNVEMLKMLKRDARDLADRLYVVCNGEKYKSEMSPLTLAHIGIAETAARHCMMQISDAARVHNGG